MAYDAFVSYSHAADGRLAPAIQRGLQRLAKPWFRLRVLSVFRDETVLAANPHLWSSIQTALDESEWFVLLASPDAVASEWVNRELAYWLAHKSADRILPVVTDGTWQWSGGVLEGAAVLPALREAFGDEPRHVDLRWVRRAEDMDLRNGRFRGAVAELAAPIHGVAKDDLESEDLRVHRRARRLARSAVAVLASLLVIAVFFGVVAATERNRAEDNARKAVREAVVADSGRVAAEARRLVDGHVDLALLLAVAARRLDDSVASRGALEATLVQGAPLARFVQLGSGTTNAAVSRDGRLLGVDRSDGRVEVRAVPSGGIATQFRGTTTQVGALAFSSDDGTVAVSHGDGTVELRDVRTGRLRGALLTGHHGGYNTLALSPDGQWLAATDLQTKVVVWNLRSRTKPATLFTPSAGATPAWSPDSDTLATGGLYGDIFLWNPATLRLRGRIPISTEELALAFSPDGHRLAAETPNGGVGLFDVTTHRLSGAPLTGTGSTIDWLTFSTDGSTLAVGDASGIVTRWDITTRKPRGRPLPGVSAGTSRAVLTGDGRLITLATDGVSVWHLDSISPPLGHLLVRLGTTSSAQLTRDGTTLLIAGGNGTRGGVLYDLRSGRSRSIASPTSGTAWDGRWSPDSTTWAVAEGDGSVVLENLATGAVLGTLVGHTGAATSLAFSPDGHLLAAGGDDGTVLIWDVATRRRLGAPLPIGGGRVWGVAFTPDGRTLASDTAGGTVVLTDVASRRVLHRLDAHQQLLRLAFSADGKTLAVAGAQGVILTDTATGQPVGAPLAGHSAQLIDVAFSRDGRTLATTSQDGTVILYDLTTRLPIGDPLTAGYGGSTEGSLTPDGHTFITGYFDGQVVAWDVDPDSWQRQACITAGRNLTHDEWHQYLGNRPYETTCPQWPAGT
jgi:WD40 repeat protein